MRTAISPWTAVSPLLARHIARQVDKGTKSYFTGPLLPRRVQSTPLSASSTKSILNEKHFQKKKGNEAVLTQRLT